MRVPNRVQVSEQCSNNCSAYHRACAGLAVESPSRPHQQTLALYVGHLLVIVPTASSTIFGDTWTDIVPSIICPATVIVSGRTDGPANVRSVS